MTRKKPGNRRFSQFGATECRFSVHVYFCLRTPLQAAEAIDHNELHEFKVLPRSWIFERSLHA
jgi:hypothetical protein